MLLLNCTSYAQNFNTEYGKNRVQYNDDFKHWSQYESSNFVTYWYGKGKNIAHTVIQIAEQNHEEIRKNLEHRINDKIEILVYVDLTDMRQSNIGTEEVFFSKSNETKVVGNKIILYFDGNHLHLRERIREGIASVYLASMLYGSNFQEVIQNAVLLKLPSWYKPGFVSYAGNNWNLTVENQLRDILSKNKKYYKFEKLAARYPEIAGHSMWHYLRVNYGRSAITNLLYHTRIARDFDRSIEFVLNSKTEIVFDEWKDYYMKKFESEQGNMDEAYGTSVKIKNRKQQLPITDLALSPDNTSIVYATNNQSQTKIYLQDKKSKRVKRLQKLSYKSKLVEPDLNTPHSAWYVDRSELTYSFEKKDRIYLRRYEVQSEESQTQILPNEIQRILAIDYIDKRYYMLNAIVNGYSDLFIYDAKDRQLYPITNDYYDDLDASVVTHEGKKQILFSSNRLGIDLQNLELDTIIPQKTFDLFMYQIPSIASSNDAKNLPKQLVKVTDTKLQNEYKSSYADGHVYYLSNESGINNLYEIDLATNRIKNKTNLNRNIENYSLQNSELLYAGTFKGKRKLYLERLEQINPSSLYKTYSIRNEEAQEEAPIVKYQEIPEHLKFQSQYEDDINGQKISITQSSEKNPNWIDKAEELSTKGIPINRVLIYAAGLRFKSNRFVTRMDNDILFEGLDLAQGQNTEVSQLPMGFLAKASFTDIFEDYHIEAGARLSTRLDGIEYFMTFDDNKKLIDRRTALYLRNYNEGNDFAEMVPPLKSKKQIFMLMHRYKYPFSEQSSLRGTAYFRNDMQYYKSTENTTLTTTTYNEKRLGLKLEYVYDNTIEKSINILQGSRAKVYVEAMNQFNLEVFNKFNLDASKGFTTILGLDARHYEPILDYSIIALRMTSAVSFGSKKILYYLGGVNNNIFPSFEQNVAVPDYDFSFKSNVPHLRGFNSNIRNGSSYALLNAELRIPFLKYLIGSQRGNNFFRNLQVIGFFDSGVAWYGVGPYDKRNPLNTVYVDDKLIDLEIQYFRDPLVYGFGYGLRSQLFGYMVKLDIGYGIETQKILTPKYYFSIGKDF